MRIVQIALIVRDYDEAIAFYCGKLGFELAEDTRLPEPGKRWVVVTPPGGKGISLVLARAVTREQAHFIGNQAGGRVWLFLQTGNFARDYSAFRSRGVEFVEEPRNEVYGTVAVFRDLYGNLWDLIEYASGHPLAVVTDG